MMNAKKKLGPLEKAKAVKEEAESSGEISATDYDAYMMSVKEEAQSLDQKENDLDSPNPAVSDSS